MGGAILHPQTVSMLTHDLDPDGTHRHTDLGFAFLADGEPTGRPAKGEPAELRWVTAEEVAVLADMPPNAREVAGIVVDGVRTEWSRFRSPSSNADRSSSPPASEQQSVP